MARQVFVTIKCLFDISCLSHATHPTRPNAYLDPLDRILAEVIVDSYGVRNIKEISVKVILIITFIVLMKNVDSFSISR